MQGLRLLLSEKKAPVGFWAEEGQDLSGLGHSGSCVATRVKKGTEKERSVRRVAHSKVIARGEKRLDVKYIIFKRK